MPVAKLTDAEINDLIALPKYLPSDYRRRLKAKVRGFSAKHEEAKLEVPVDNTGTFRVIIRKNLVNLQDFSIILGYISQDKSGLIRLKRHNGIHEHTNKIEGITFREFHIHRATQRYQETGFDIDAYAEPTDKYSNADEALETFLDDCNFIRPDSDKNQTKMPLF